LTHRWYGRPYDAANCLFGQVAHQDPETIGNDMRLLKAGATAKNWKIIPNLRNQLHCPGTNNCTNGCPTGAKRSMLVTNVPRALARGARVFADCRVERITQSRGTVTGIEGRFVRAGGHRGPRLTVRAQVVVAAGGAVQTPALLARSGLRSRSGLLGRNLTLHPNAKVIAFFDEEVIGWHGVHQAYQVREFIDDGILLTAVNLPPSLVAAGSPPDVTGLTGYEFRGYNQPRAAALLGIRKFIKAFYLDSARRPFSCNTPVGQNGLDGEWLARPSAAAPSGMPSSRSNPPAPTHPKACTAARRS